jgi:hypothetical protein
MLSYLWSPYYKPSEASLRSTQLTNATVIWHPPLSSFHVKKMDTPIEPSQGFWTGLPPYLRVHVTEQVQLLPELVAELDAVPQDTPLAIKLAKLQDVLETTYAERAKTLGQDALLSRNALHAVGMLQSATKSFSAAESTYRKLIDISILVDKNNPPPLAAMSNLAWTLTQQEKFAEAEKLQRELLPLLDSDIRLGKSSPQSLGCIRMMAMSVAGQGRNEEAKELLHDGYQRVEGIREGEWANFEHEEVEALDEVSEQVEYVARGWGLLLDVEGGNAEERRQERRRRIGAELTSPI